jgi:hypothetical protein
MKHGLKIFRIIALVALAATLGSSYAAAQTGHYVVTNSDFTIPMRNFATVFGVNESTGQLIDLLALETNGTGLGGGYFALPRVASSANCIFVSDAGSSVNGSATGDIASFTAPAFTLVGNFSDPTLSGTTNGIGMVVNPNGQYLYAGYTTTYNIGVWQIGSDCSLSLVNSYYVAHPIDDLVVAQQSGGAQFLAMTLPDLFTEQVDLFAISGGGATLTEQASGPISTAGTPSTVATTQDGNVIVVGDATNPTEVETWWISNTSAGCSPSAPPCLTSHQNFISLGMGNNSSNLVLSPQAASNPTTGGCMYISNNSSIQMSSAKFVEGTTPGSVAIRPTAGSPFTVALGSGVNYLATILTGAPSGTGDRLYVFEYTSIIATIPVNSNCVLGKGSVSPNLGLASAISMAAWPPQ